MSVPVRTRHDKGIGRKVVGDQPEKTEGQVRCEGERGTEVDGFS